MREKVMIPTTTMLCLCQILTIAALLGIVSAANSNQTVSYESGGHHRSTFDIINSCLAALLASVWSVLHLNVPAKGDGSWLLFFRKMKWMVIMIIAPEIVCGWAVLELRAARASVQRMRIAGHEEWSIVHGFFANQGGFVIEYGEYERKRLPLLSSQLLVIVESGHGIVIPTVSVQDINDKSKVNQFAKGFACLQSSWLVLNVMVRGIQGLAVSQLEIMTISYVVIASIVYGILWRKPYDVGIPIMIHDNFGETFPQDLWQRLEQAESDIWGGQVRGERIENGTSLKASKVAGRSYVVILLETYIVIILGVVFIALHLAAWNFAYPSTVELWLWKAFSSSALLSLCLYSVTFWRTSISDIVGKCVGFFSLWPIILYITARVYLVVEAFISLRAAPASLYQTISWLSNFPHI